MNKKIGFIGAGNMGAALLCGIASSDIVTVEQLIACDLNTAKLDELSKLGITTTTSIDELMANADVIILAIKPQGFESLLTTIAPNLDASRHLIISIAAGVSIKTIEDALPKQTRVIRSMPNLPVSVGNGVSVFARGKFADDNDVKIADILFGASGVTRELPEESLDAVTGLSGSGPAYLFYMADSLIEAGVKAGLAQKDARFLVAHTFFGAGEYFAKSEDTAEKLISGVKSPGGTTEAAINYLDANNAAQIIEDAVAKAIERSQELGKK